MFLVIVFEALKRRRPSELLAKCIEDLDSHTPLVVHDLNGIGHNRLLLQLLQRQDQQTPNDHSPLGCFLIGQEITGIQGLTFFPDVPPLHNRVDGLFSRLNEPDRLCVRLCPFIRQGLRLKLAQFLSDRLDLARNVLGALRDMQHDVDCRQRQGPVFFG